MPDQDRALIDLWLPSTVEVAAPPGDRTPEQQPARAPLPAVEFPRWSGGPVEFDRVVPPSGNMIVCQRQFWMGPGRAGMVARIWANCELIHVLVGGTRIKTVRSHLTVSDLAELVAAGAVPGRWLAAAAGRGRRRGRGGTLRVPVGLVSLAGKQILAVESLGGRRVGIRIEPAVLMFYDLETRELLRTRTNPLTPDQVQGLKGQRPAGAPPRPSAEPVRVQRRVSNTGGIRVAGQKVAMGRIHRHQTVTVLVSETTLAIELPDGDTKVVRRTTTQPVRASRASGRGPPPQFPRPCVAHQLADMCRGSVVGSQRCPASSCSDLHRSSRIAADPNVGARF